MASPRKPIATLEDLHALGRALERYVRKQSKNAAKPAYGQGAIQAFCKEHRVRLNEAYAARRFVEAYPVGSEDLKHLLQLRTPANKPLCKTHVGLLLEVHNVKRRESLAEQCADEGWSTKQLTRHIRTIQGSSNRPGARAPRVTKKTEALALLEDVTTRWLKWSEGLFRQAEEPRRQDLKRVRLDNLPREIGDLLEKARKPMELLKAEIGRTLRGEGR